MSGHIDEKRLLAEFERLVAFDAESFHEGEIQRYVRRRLEALGLAVREDDAAQKIGAEAGNLYGFLPGTRPGAPLLFSAHLDTVSPGRGKRAVQQPDGRITSDGTTVLGADDAAGIAAILEALTVIREHDLPHPDLEVLFPVAEEVYGCGSAVADYTALRAKTAYVLDLTGPVGTAAVRAPSILSVDVRVTGRAAHAGFAPEDGVNALTAAARALAGLTVGRIDNETTVNFGTITGGTGKNIIPAEVRVSGEIRSLRHETALACAREIETRFQAAAASLGAAADVTVTEYIRAYEIDADEPVARRFQRAVGALGLGDATFLTTFGGSDNNNFALHGIRGVVAACAMNAVHTTQEYTEPAELKRSAELTLLLMTMEEEPA